MLSALSPRNQHRDVFSRKRRRGFRPMPEALEGRCVLSTLTVTKTTDSGAGSLRADIAAARSGDTINFAIPTTDPGYNPAKGVFTITLTSGELLIKNNLTITGPANRGVTVSGNNTSRVFEVAKVAGKVNLSLQVALSGLTITNGFTNGSTGYSSSGGGILNEAVLTVSNCTFSYNSAPAGGGIHNDGTLTIAGSTLFSNSTTPHYGSGGGIYNSGALTIGGSILSFNSSADDGGGIWNNGSLTVNASTLSGNSARLGGGIWNQSGIVGALAINSSTLSGNSALVGGGIYDSTGSVTISGTTLTGNSATYEGGGIYLENGTGSYASTVTVKNSSTIAGDTAPVGSGADVDNLGQLYLDTTSTIGILDGNSAVPI